MQTIHVSNLSFSEPRLLPQNACTSGVVPSGTLNVGLMPRLTPTSLIRRIGTLWLWRRQSQISCKWIAATPSASWRFVQLVRQSRRGLIRLPENEVEATFSGSRLTTALRLAGAAETEWQDCRRREAVIRPVINACPITHDRVDEAAKQLELDLSRTLLYRLIVHHRHRTQTSSLLPARRGRAPHSCVLDQELDALIHSAADGIYLNRITSFVYSLGFAGIQKGTYGRAPLCALPHLF